MSITATVENNTIKLPAGVHLPDGTQVRVEALEETGPTLAERLAPFIGVWKDGPTDLAINHDHHLYGAPKQKP
jgi:hypothetical protein